MNAQIKYYIIFTISYQERDNETGQFLSMPYLPKIVKRPLFVPTDVERDENRISKKYIGLLTPDQLIEFVDLCEFTDTCQTQGALTLEYGLLPAISFSETDSYYYGYEFNAYISPVISNYDDLCDELDKLPEKQKEVVLNRVYKETDSILNYLENDLLDKIDETYNLDEIELPSFCQEFFIDLFQLQFDF
jgi:hypothetical protein